MSGRSGASVRQRARPSRHPLRGSPHFVRLGLDRLRSLPHSVAMIDTSVRGRLAPRPSAHANLDRRAHGHGRALRLIQKTKKLSLRRLEFGYRGRISATPREPQNREEARLGRRRRSLHIGASITANRPTNPNQSHHALLNAPRPDAAWAPASVGLLRSIPRPEAVPSALGPGHVAAISNYLSAIGKAYPMPATYLDS